MVRSMEKSDNRDLYDFDKIKRDLKIRKIKGKNYYYLKGFLGKMKYFSPVDITEKQMADSLCYFIQKEFLSLIKEFYEYYNQLSTNYISKKQNLYLSLIILSSQTYLSKFKKTDLQSYEDAFFTKYVYGTTSIEGNTCTLRETSLILDENISVGGKNLREIFEIENYRKINQYIKDLEFENLKIDLNFIKKIHSLLLANIKNSGNGDFRNIEVFVKGADFQPTPAIFIEDEMNDLVNFYMKNKDKMHPIEMIATFHHKFERIHPFLDGNGRVGRELMRIMLKKLQLPTIFIDQSNRNEYLEALAEGDKGNIKPLTLFLIESLISDHEILINDSKEIIQNFQSKSICENCTSKKKCDKIPKKMLDLLNQ